MDATIRFEHELLAVETEHAVHCMLQLDLAKLPTAARAPLRIAGNRGARPRYRIRLRASLRSRSGL